MCGYFKRRIRSSPYNYNTHYLPPILRQTTPIRTHVNLTDPQSTEHQTYTLLLARAAPPSSKSNFIVYCKIDSRSMAKIGTKLRIGGLWGRSNYVNELSENIKLGKRWSGVALFLFVLVNSAIPLCVRLPKSCMEIYGEGGSTGILQSPGCFHWIQSIQSVRNQTKHCQYTMRQGIRWHRAMYDHYHRLLCNLDMLIPLPGKHGPEEVRVGVVALFDGFMGEEASEMASKLLLEYFLLHSVFMPYKEKSMGNKNSNRSIPVMSNESRHMRIFKEALLRSIYDINKTFLKEALERHLYAGSTANIAVLVDGHLLVANVGHSKALLCSENAHSHLEANGHDTPFLSVKELTEDHSPNRAVERERLVAGGCEVFVWRNSTGVIAEPEVTDWQPITASDTHLVVATHSIFRKLTPQKVCDSLHPAPQCFPLASLSDCIALAAQKEGSRQHLSVIVVPLKRW